MMLRRLFSSLLSWKMIGLFVLREELDREKWLVEVCEMNMIVSNHSCVMRPALIVFNNKG